MYDCLVVSLPMDRGVYQELRGMQRGIYGLVTPPESDGDMIDYNPMEEMTIWSCYQQDASKVAELMATSFVGKDIKIFNLTEIVSRLPGELKRKTVTKSGILPE